MHNQNDTLLILNTVSYEILNSNNLNACTETLLAFLMTLEAMDSPERVLSTLNPKYLTEEA